MATEDQYGLEITELRLGLPGGGGERKDKKRVFHDIVGGGEEVDGGGKNRNTETAVGWPPVCSYRKKAIVKMYVKVSMDGAPFLRKIDINRFKGYSDFVIALENLFGIGDECEYIPIYEDKNGDWMLVGFVPWDETSMWFSRAVAKLEHMVIRLLFESYGVEKHSESHINSTTYLLRYLKYRAPEMNETTMAFPSHTDKSFLTILHQNQVSGLEIRSRDDEWISVEFPPSSFVVMAGDACKAWSNNRVLSPNHKVTLDKKGRKTRYTIALFSFLSNKVQVPDEFVDEEHPLQFKPFNHVDLLNFYDTETGRKSQNILQDFCGV